MNFETVAEAFAFALWERRFDGCGRGCAVEGSDLLREDFEFGDEVAGGEVAKECLIGLRIIVRALDQDAGEEAVGDFGSGVGPDLFVSRGK